MKTIIAGCRAGDPVAWSELIDRTSRLVYGIALRHGLTQEGAEDVSQETYLALYRNLEKLKSEEALPRWLAVTAARFARRAKHKSRTKQQVSMEHPDFEQWEKAAISESISPEQTIVIKEGLRELPPRCQKVLNALFFEGLSYSEAAEQLGVAVGSLGAMQSRCLERLAGLLAGEDKGAR